MNKIIQDLNINYHESGEGTLVVLLHGWGSGIKPFDALIAQVEKGYKVVALDMPGFGLSDEPKEPWDVSRYVKLVKEFISGFSAEKVILLGHSFGGRVIIKMMNEELPFSVEKIILVDSAGVKPEATTKQKINTYTYKTGRKIMETAPMRKLFPDAVENMRNSRGSEDYRAASPMMRQTLVKVVNEDLTEYMPAIKVPVLLIWGEHDTATPLADAKIMEKLMPAAGLATIPNAGHYSFLDQPYTFHKIIASFLKLAE